MINILIENLTKILHAMALLGIAWLADCFLSSYRNVGILSQEWDKTRFFNSVKRIVVLIVGLVLIVVVITDLPIFISEVGVTIPEEYVEVFSMVSLLLAIVITASKYIAGAIEAFFDILNYKKLKEQIESEVIQSGDIEASEIVYAPQLNEKDFIEYLDEDYVEPKE